MCADCCCPYGVVLVFCRPEWGSFKMSFGCDRYQPPMSFWGASKRPTSLTYNVESQKRFNWSNPSTGVLHAFHGGHWGGWQFRIQSHSSETKTIELDPMGGQQEARGSSSGAEWYVENLIEEVDSGREWFLDTQSAGSTQVPTEFTCYAK